MVWKHQSQLINQIDEKILDFVARISAPQQYLHHMMGLRRIGVS